MTELASPQLDEKLTREARMRSAVKEPVDRADFDTSLSKVAASLERDALVRSAIEQIGDNPFLTPSEQKMDKLVGHSRSFPVYLLGAYSTGHVVPPLYVEYNGNRGGGTPGNAQKIPGVVHN